MAGASGGIRGTLHMWSNYTMIDIEKEIDKIINPTLLRRIWWEIRSWYLQIRWLLLYKNKIPNPPLHDAERKKKNHEYTRTNT